jgi:hypothetical protein
VVDAGVSRNDFGRIVRTATVSNGDTAGRGKPTQQEWKEVFEVFSFVQGGGNDVKAHAGD